MRTILTGLVGSKAYGLDHAESDDDFLSVHVAEIDDILGLDYWSVQDKSIVKSEPDHTSHELAKFCRLGLKGNPTVNELLWLTEYARISDAGGMLIDLRQSFLSAHTMNAYTGYIYGQIKKLTLQDGTPTARFPKASRHVLRLCVQLRHLVEHGEIRPLLHPQEVEWVRYWSGYAVSNNIPSHIERLADDYLWAYTELQVHPLLRRPEPDYAVINQAVIDIRRMLE